jgi:hypothetical protein
MDAIFLAIAFYLLYRFLTGFLIPVFRTTRKVRQQFNQMNGQPGAGPSGNPGNSTRQSSQNTDPGNSRSHGAKVGEYIDFEEVKE